MLVIYMKTQNWYILDLQVHKRIDKKQVAHGHFSFLWSNDWDNKKKN